MLSVCIIAKNEENNITRCLSSVEEIADEIILVDTGCTDYTVPIAKGFGAKIIHSPFENDFSKARNASISKATKKWIFYIDCDEQLEYEDMNALRELLKQEEYEGICLSLTNVIEGKKQLTLPSLRIFRNREEYAFEGKIHEQINPSIERMWGKGKVFVSDIRLYHYGYDEAYAVKENKIKRNIDLFNSYTEEEKDGFYYYNLANEYLRINNLDKALENYDKAMDMEDRTGYKIYIPMYGVKCLHEQKRFQEAVDYGNKFLKSYPNYKDLHFLMTACYFEMGNFEKSKEHLELFLEYGKEDYGYPEFNFKSSNNIDALMEDINRLIEDQSTKNL